MFATALARLRAPRNRPSKSKKLRVNRLECRDVPATAVDPLATFGGTVDVPHHAGWVQMQVQTSSRVLLAFESDPAAGSAFKPGPLGVFEGEGPHSKALGSGGNHGFALESVSSGIHFAKVVGAQGSTGAFDVTVRLAGDINGDSQVDEQDLDVIRSLHGVRAGQDGYVEAADVDHNGVITLRDLHLAERNLGRTATVGDITADQFLFSNAGPRFAQFNAKTMPGISLVINGINDSLTPISVESFSWSLQHPPTGGPVKDDLSVTSKVGTQSPRLFLAAALGTPFTDATLFMGRAGGGKSAKPRLEWDMSNVLISSYLIDGSNDAKLVSDERFSLNFTKLRVTYTPTLPNGAPGAPVSAEFDFAGPAG
jgi:type VI protein secretion system component Hcp